VFYWATVCKNGSPYAIDRCPVLSVYCVQTVVWIKMKLDKQVGLGHSSHIVLDGDPAPLP